MNWRAPITHRARTFEISNFFRKNRLFRPKIALFKRLLGGVQKTSKKHTFTKNYHKSFSARLTWQINYVKI